MGFNIPLGTGGFRDPASADRTLAKQQLAATLALVESLAYATPEWADDLRAAAGSGSTGPAGPGLHVDPQAAAEDDIDPDEAREWKNLVDDTSGDTIIKGTFIALVVGGILGGLLYLRSRFTITKKPK